VPVSRVEANLQVGPGAGLKAGLYGSTQVNLVMSKHILAFLVCTAALMAPVSTAPQSPAGVTPAATAPRPAALATRPQARVPALATPLLSGLSAAAGAAGPPAHVLRLALQATTCALNTRAITTRPSTLTLIDYSRPSTERRLWVFDLASGRLLFEELVAHGKATGENLARHFSDTLNSHQSSLGLFVARDTYVGSNGYSLRLDGLEPGFNGRARERAIVMHGAPYVDEAMARRQGRLGRSWGCPALREAVARKVIDTVRDGGVIFSYYPDDEWLEGSRLLNCG
jgi:hypothetical protein